MSGLNSVSLTRLKYIWEGLSKADVKVCLVQGVCVCVCVSSFTKQYFGSGAMS
jgi:hypothetical protein